MHDLWTGVMNTTYASPGIGLGAGNAVVHKSARIPLNASIYMEYTHIITVSDVNGVAYSEGQTSRSGRIALRRKT